jgi:hypothetical protein
VEFASMNCIKLIAFWGQDLMLIFPVLSRLRQRLLHSNSWHLSVFFFLTANFIFFGLVNCKYINRLKPMHKHYNKESKKVTLLIWTNRKGQLGSQTRKPRTTAETKARHYKTKHMLSKNNHKYKSFNIATLETHYTHHNADNAVHQICRQLLNE